MLVSGTRGSRRRLRAWPAGPGLHVHTREDEASFANRGDAEAWIVGVTSPAGIEAMFEEQAAYFAGLAGDPDRSTWLNLVPGSASLRWVRP